ncbi:hypothetical protein E2C00_28835 [Streptomyces sp. WAC05374]|uniref:hypothetical protein n=1 Tax=Streptomyces sp. WAC05374 TaxID=2487420 RepID=UPI000F85DD2B|nr:hypothetical protein [Streptomyces sp. WAC05374]RST14247.1 hypothetical protein EF905_18015 [Streptomyces sp. WAC05374]TDF40768.1 hypothetical protein E2B92_24250 [Streptomyces sp. WAC05374]TDF49495.1 hypothetical protein E2C00_28835 [Streptomyces sp. WAC05374]TDF49985.1 hypothetical protein E2C02_25865 [Streptomyces sp. WAC05374]
MSLPGADELFRTTGGMALQSSTPRRQNGEPRVPAPAGESDPAAAAPAAAPEEHAAAEADAAEPRSRAAEEPAPAPATPPAKAAPARRRGRAANRRPSGRERHDEKITVYVSAEELMDLEHARLVLRGEHGLAVDRGRIVREAVAVVLADLESRGDASILVRRLRGR